MGGRPRKKKSPGPERWPWNTELFLLVVLVCKVAAVVHQVAS